VGFMVIRRSSDPRGDTRSNQAGQSENHRQASASEIDPEIVRDLIKGSIDAIDTHPLPRKIIISRIRIVRLQNQRYTIRCVLRQQ
jgi:hypothetical protein